MVNSKNFQTAVETILTAYKEGYLNNSLMREEYKKQAVERIEKALNFYKRSYITADEALEIGLHPFR